MSATGCIREWGCTLFACFLILYYASIFMGIFAGHDTSELFKAFAGVAITSIIIIYLYKKHGLDSYFLPGELVIIAFGGSFLHKVWPVIVFSLLISLPACYRIEQFRKKTEKEALESNNDKDDEFLDN